ncbi:cytochrome P450 [Planomonospora venezuelensis]|uniref:Cytochrome P450 n=1 Tax=Planomonospora venezuelensis TaxID=1999 RepID=A0A841D6G7_PLAVE|nr:cytochrome P450 [Planomonospora venezuelensis]MBB5964094.1 cytochrome P450 [Planomonospora venezuelensis]GIM99718.1 cytochrome P450 [Planomonospora venezuelensis]
MAISIGAGAGTARRVRSVPIRRALRRLTEDPAEALLEFAQEAGGEVVRLELGPFRPYLVTHPDHVQQVMRLEWTNYQRVGMFWRPLERLFGHSIMGDGEPWRTSRDILQPLFTTRYIATIAEEVSARVAGRIEEWDEHARAGRSIDATAEMSGILTYIVNRVLFGDKLSREDAERIVPAFDLVSHSLVYRFLMPFMPYFIRVPRDRACLRGVKQIDDVVFPVVERAMANPDDGLDVISVLCRSTNPDGRPLTAKQIRDALVSVYAASSETTAMILTWLWLILEEHPDVAARLQAEIDEVVGDGPARPEHVPRLAYTRMVLLESLRLYPSGWLLPRQVMEDAEIGGVRIKAGATVLISSYATQRLEEFWDRPNEFDPERFASDKGPDGERRHRYSYFPFGGGPHKCLGEHLFYVEAPLVVAAILSRYRISVRTPGPFTVAWAASLRPKGRIELGVSFAGRDRSVVPS